LAEADELKLASDAALSRAREIIEGLLADGLLQSPVGGFHFGGDQVLSGANDAHSLILDRFYRMWRFVGPRGWKGAYHNSASVANQQSLPGIHHELELLEADARTLRDKLSPKEKSK
jgi:hypothetical protein